MRSLNGLKDGLKIHLIPRKHSLLEIFSTVSIALHADMLLGSCHLGLYPSETAAKTAVRYAFLCLGLNLYVYESDTSWIPRGDWGCATDPSGRSVTIHNAAYNAE